MPSDIEGNRLDVQRAKIARAGRAHLREQSIESARKLADARSEYAEAKAARAESDYASKLTALVDAAPPLSAATRDRLALLLSTAGRAA